MLILTDIISILGLLGFLMGSSVTVKPILSCILTLIVLMLALVLLMLKKHNGLDNFKIVMTRVDILAIFISILCILSAIVSTDKIRTLWTSYNLLIYTFLGVIISKLYDEKRFIQLLTRFILVVIILSYIMLIKNPLEAFSDGLGFKGIFAHKNRMATICLFMYIYIDYYKSTYKNEKYLKIINLFLILNILLCNSTTNYILFILYLIYMICRKINNVKLAKNVIYCTIISTGIVTVFNNYFLTSNFASIFYKITGKTIGFSGRTDIWKFALNLIGERPLLGYGYNGLWSNTEYINQARMKYNYINFSTATHNAYLNILLIMGWVGLIIMSIYYYNIFKCLKNKKEICISFLFIIIMSFFESNLLVINFIWFTNIVFSNYRVNKNDMR